MPYILPSRRRSFDAYINQLADQVETEGELNYVITSIIDKWGTVAPGYAEYNRVIGVLECVKLEYYRRRLVEYEDLKLMENGDVYT